MPDSLPFELSAHCQQCRARRWRLPVWAHGDAAFRLSCWRWLKSQLTATDRVFWLGEADFAATDALAAEPLQGQVQRISGQARQQLLGQECDVLVIMATSGVDWDLVAASMGCLTAGGIWLLFTADAAEFTQQPNPAARRLLSYPTDANCHVGHFQTWLAAQWQQASILQWTVQGLTGALPTPAPALATPATVAPYASSCQQQAVEAIWRVVQGHRHRPLVLSAHRGRGKSAALGIAAAQLLQAGKSRIIITAPQPAAAQVALDTCAALCAQSDTAQLQFWPLDRLLQQQPAADLLLIDEAAAIPAPQLQALVTHYSRVVLATTEHGYEGTGRGFQLRFQHYLQQHKPGWRKFVLQQPIRYGVADPLEQLLFDSFLLDDEQIQPVVQLAIAEHAQTQTQTQTQTNCYQAADLVRQPTLLRQVFRLACLAHYQTSVRDLWALLDDPALRVVTLQQGDLVLAVAVISAEGSLPDALVQQIYQGQRRVQGHLAAQSLVYHCLTAAAGALSIWRIQRVMVQPELQQQGLGTQLLSQISALAQSQQVDLLSTSFGATAQLVQFWQRLGFVAVKLSQQAEQSSNEFSVLMCRPLRLPSVIDFPALQHWFGRNLYQLADSVWSTLDVVLLREWALPPVQQWSDFDQQNLQLFVAGQRDWQQSRVMLQRWLDLNYQHLSADEAALWLRHCWQGAAQSLPAHALNALALQLRQTRRLADTHQVFSS